MSIALTFCHLVPRKTLANANFLPEKHNFDPNKFSRQIAINHVRVFYVKSIILLYQTISFLLRSLYQTISFLTTYEII